LVALALAACGSTVRLPVDASSLGSPDGVDDLAGPVPGVPTGAATLGPGGTGTTGGSGTGSTGTSSTGGLSTGSGGGTAGDPGQPLPTAGPPGKPVRVGILIVPDLAGAGSQVGFTVDAGNPQRQAQAVVDDINSRGGLGGRRIEPYYQKFNDTSLEDQYDLACTAFTQDHKVEAVLNSQVGVDAEFVGCLAKAGIPVIGSGGLLLDDADYAKYPGFYYAPTSLSATRMAPAWVDVLRDAGYFGGWDSTAGAAGKAPVRIGIIRDDTASAERATTRVLRPALQRAGYVVAAEAAPRGQQQAPNAVLTFKQANVSHVMFFSSGGGTSAYFAGAARNARYHPRYALTSYDSPGATGIPAQELPGAFAMGWSPVSDVDTSHRPKPSNAYSHCKAIMAKAGQDISTGVIGIFALGFCDAGFFLERLALRTRGVLKAPSLRSASGSLGRQFQAAASLGTNFVPNRYDGAGAVRTVRFGGSCSCFEYVGSLRLLN
jgi:hypothetical protein